MAGEWKLRVEKERRKKGRTRITGLFLSVRNEEDDLAYGREEKEGLSTILLLSGQGGERESGSGEGRERGKRSDLRL